MNLDRSQPLLLLPAPRRLRYTGNADEPPAVAEQLEARLPETQGDAASGLRPDTRPFEVWSRRLIVLDGETPQALRLAARRLQKALWEHAGAAWEVSAGTGAPGEQVGAALRVAPGRVARPQGYVLSIAPGGVVIEGHDPAGIFYGVCTLIQIVEQSNGWLPTVEIEDWPDFAARGVMLDVSRDKVPRLKTLLELVDMLAGWKLNQLQLYTEHTFAYQNHPEVWAGASPVTGEDILELDAYCRERHVELVPNQNSCGHLQRWLSLPRYSALAETLEEFDTPWGPERGPFSLCPVDPASLEFVAGLYDELLPHFTSRMVNVGCDETYDVGTGRSRDACSAGGTGRVYLEYLLKVYETLRGRGRTMQFWGDIIIQHPELISELPRDAIALEWGYEADHVFDRHGARFAAAGLPFYVCPGTSTWLSLAGRTDNALANLANAAENGLKHGAAGYLMTDWGDRGHWQTLTASFLPLAMGAAYSWALETNRGLDAREAASCHAFHDPAGAMGRVAFDLGNAYQAAEMPMKNGTALFWALQTSLRELRGWPGTNRKMWLRSLEAIERAIEPLSRARMARPDAGLIVREYALAARLMRHACRRGLLAFEDEPRRAEALRRELASDMSHILSEYREMWLARNRPGGLPESAGRLEKVGEEYRT